MNRGGYPPGVFEHTRGAPWNEYQTEKCNGCGRLYYPAERPRGILPDDMSYPPETDYGREFSLCINCEREYDICNECHAVFIVKTCDYRGCRSGHVPSGSGVSPCSRPCPKCNGRGAMKPRAVDGCTECKLDPPCIRCGAPVSACECRDCDACDGTGSVDVKNYPLWPEDKRNFEILSDECQKCNGTGIDKGEK